MSREYGLVSACGASSRLCGQARANFKCVIAAFEPTVTWTKPLYIILLSSLALLPPSLSSLFSLIISPSLSSRRWSRYVRPWALSCLMTQGASYQWKKCLLKDKQRSVSIYDNMKDKFVLMFTRGCTICFPQQMW